MARVLPVEEWSRLDSTLLATVWRQMNPAHAEVLVVERDGDIVASGVLLTALHAECVSSSGVSAGRAFWTLLRARVGEAGGKAVWGAAVDEPMRSLLERHGEPIPGDHFLVRV